MTPHNPTPTDSKDQASAHTSSLAHSSRRAWGCSKAVLDVQVGNLRDITFALQARLPRVSCETYAQNAKYGCTLHAPAARAPRNPRKATESLRERRFAARAGENVDSVHAYDMFSVNFDDMNGSHHFWR